MNKEIKERPSVKEIEAELKRVKYRSRYNTVMKSTVYTLITVAAMAVLVATLWLPVLEIFGSSMTPTFNDGDIVFSVKTEKMEKGDIIAFYYNNKILVKRVIATSGSWVEMDVNGTVFVDNVAQVEDYITDKSYGDADIDFPYQVPEGKVFVMGDHRATSVDSRHSAVGCIEKEQVVGKIVFRVWPLDSFGAIK